MKPGILLFVFYFLILVFYIVLINVFSGVLDAQFLSLSENNTLGEMHSGMDEIMKTTDNVNIVITKKRIYGTFIENIGLRKVSYLYLFGFIPLPWYNKISFAYFHFLFVICYLIAIILVYLKLSSRKKSTMEEKHEPNGRTNMEKDRESSTESVSNLFDNAFNLDNNP